jgi:4-carboxymuconolactone decarboxylase
VNEEGGVVGPYNAWLTAPAIGTRMADLARAFRFETSIDRRLLELAIITTAAGWDSEFGRTSHSQMARDAGIDDVVVDAIARNQVPRFTRGDEQAVYEVAEELVADGHISAETYREAQALIGDQGMVELVSVCGFYTLVSFTLNAFLDGPPCDEDAREVGHAVGFPDFACALTMPPIHW